MRRGFHANRIQNIRKHGLLLVMILPGIVYLFINNYLPMFGIVIAFKDINFAKGIWGSDWVGFDNFAYLFQTQDAWVITRNTLLYNGAFIVLGTVLSIAVAVLLNEVKKRFVSRLYQSIIFFALSDLDGHCRLLGSGIAQRGKRIRQPLRASFNGDRPRVVVCGFR